MAAISPSAEAEQEAHRQRNGQFGRQERSEAPPLDLGVFDATRLAQSAHSTIVGIDYELEDLATGIITREKAARIEHLVGRKDTLVRAQYILSRSDSGNRAARRFARLMVDHVYEEKFAAAGNSAYLEGVEQEATTLAARALTDNPEKQDELAAELRSCIAKDMSADCAVKQVVSRT